MSSRTRPATRPRPTAGTRRRQATPDRRPLFAALAAVAVLAVAAIVWIVARNDDSPDSAGAATGVAHVHGLGVDPASGTLWVATHHGVFRLPENGTAERVGPVQDTMGFTVVGADHFLGSGHPGPDAQGQPPLLGLIESTDGAATWQDVSLSGEVDFHALAYAHDQVYGWDSTSGRLMVSADRQQWDTRSTLQLFGFAVDPTEPETIAATTPEGVQTSNDGGRSWQPASGSPELILIAWDAGSGLWGVDPGGSVYHTTGLELDWEPAGNLPGPPQALLADGETLYAAAESDGTTGIYQSTDRGTTWQERYRDQQ